MAHSVTCLSLQDRGIFQCPFYVSAKTVGDRSQELATASLRYLDTTNVQEWGSRIHYIWSTKETSVKIKAISKNKF